MKIKLIRFVFFIGIGLLGTITAVAGAPLERTNSSALWFENWGDLSNASLAVISPEGVRVDVRNERGTPVFRLRDLTPVVDGVYSYELRAASSEKIKIRNPIDNGRGKMAKTEMAKPYLMNGFFIVKRGVITRKDNQVEE